MPTFICSLSWTDKGIQSPEKISTRRDLARGEVADAFRLTVKQIFYTSGDDDILMIMDAPDGEAVAKWALFIGSRGNVRTRTVRAFTEDEFNGILDDALSRLNALRP
jgi:uncharacterized protein with GYD domain